MQFKTQFSICFLLLFSLLLSSCRDSEGFRKTSDGLFYKFINDEDGPKPEPGDIMVMDILYTNGRDSLLFDSRILSDSFTVVCVLPTFIGGVEEGFAMMSPGDSALFKANADSLMEKTFKNASPYQPIEGEFIRFQVKMRSIIKKKDIDSVMIATDLRLRRVEFDDLESYLRRNKMDVTPTQNGAFLTIKNEGNGPKPEAGDTVYVNYKGYLLNGLVFDSTSKGPFKFVLGTTPVLEGWVDCIPLLSKGSEATIAFPSDLGFGSQKTGVIPPYSPLIFEVRIVDIKKGIKRDTKSPS
ncbi:MAG: FKBP-type peptidyl-prolyl cis-trans isomerase [Bacteroidota bacterium]